MIMLRADTWLLWDYVTPTPHSPVVLLSGNRCVHLSTNEGIAALQRLGVPLIVVTVEDFVRTVKKNLLYDGARAYPIPPPYENLGN